MTTFALASSVITFPWHHCYQEKTETSDALVIDLELLGTAYEDLQEQNMRLLQQLKEKDDANFKLMSERIKVRKYFGMLYTKILKFLNFTFEGFLSF